MEIRADQFRVAPMRRRRVSRSRPEAISPDMTLLDGNIRVFDVNSTSEVAPDGTVDVELSIDAGSIGSVMGDHEDCCGPFCHGLPVSSSQNGYLYQVIVRPEWVAAENSPEMCLDVDPVGSPDDDWSFDFPAPSSEGSYTVEIEVRLPNSGRSNSVSRQVQVTEGGGSRPGPDDCSMDEDCSSGQVCENGRCVAGGGGGGIFDPIFGDFNPLAGVNQLLTLLIVIMVLYFGARLLLSQQGSGDGQQPVNVYTS